MPIIFVTKPINKFSSLRYAPLLELLGELKDYSYTSVGGDIDGGSAAYFRSVGFTAVGGDIDGGSAEFMRSAGFTGSGGDIDGGAASVVGTLGRSGSTSPDSIVILPKGKVGIKIDNTTYLEV